MHTEKQTESKAIRQSLLKASLEKECNINGLGSELCFYNTAVTTQLTTGCGHAKRGHITLTA